MRLDATDLADIRQSMTDEGAECLWESKTKTLKDADKPWLGTTSEPVNHTVWIAFVDMATAAALLSQWGKDNEVSSSTLYGLMGNHGFDPVIGERVLRTDKEDLIAKDITEASPAGVPLFYLLEFNA